MYYVCESFIVLVLLVLELARGKNDPKPFPLTRFSENTEDF